MEKTTIRFTVIDLQRTTATSCPLMLSADSTLFNDIELTRLKGKYYKAVLESNNIVTFYYRDPQIQHMVAHRYAVAVNWMRTDDRLAGGHKTPQAINIAERVVYQRLLSMVKLINTGNI
jgi:hypothetical protein